MRFHGSHTVDAWQQYGLVPAGPDSTDLITDITQRCRWCEMAVRIGDDVTVVGLQPCVGAPPGR